MKLEAGILSRLAAESFGGDAAVECHGRTLSFNELNAAGSALLGAGLQRGDRVGVLGYNCPELAETWLGLEKRNLVHAVLHTHIDADAHVRSMNHIEATALIFDTRVTHPIDAHRDELKMPARGMLLTKTPTSQCGLAGLLCPRPDRLRPTRWSSASRF